MQQCGNYLKGKENCDAKAVYQEVLEGATLQMLNEVFIKNINILEIIKSVISKNITVSDVETKIEELKDKRNELETLIGNLIDMKLKTPSFDDAIFNTKYSELKHELHKLNLDQVKYENEYMNTYDTKSRLATINQALTRYKTGITEIETDILKAFIFKIIAVEYNSIIFCVAGGKKYNDNEFAEKRYEFIKCEEIASGTYFYEKYNQKMDYKVVII